MKVGRLRALTLLPAIALAVALTPTASAAIPLGYHPFTPDTVTGGANCAESSRDLKGCEHAKAIVSAIKGVPCSTKELIRVPIFNMNFPAYSEALVRKARCGVQLRVLTWHGRDDDGSMVTPSRQVLDIRDAIKKSGRGWYKDCANSCYSTSKKDSLHFKAWLFSHTTGRADVVIVDENNATVGGDSRMFGSWTTMADRCVYNGLGAWIDKGRADRKRKAPKPIQSCDKKRTVYLTPSKTNAAVAQLKAVKKGKGCRVDLDVFQVTMTAPVKEMKRLRKAKCRTRAIVDWKKISGPDGSKAQQRRIRELVMAGVETRDSSWRLPTYNHRKTVITPTSVSSGATNQTAASFASANLILVSRDRADVKAAWKASDAMARYSRLLTKASVGCVGAHQPKGC